MPSHWAGWDGCARSWWLHTWITLCNLGAMLFARKDSRKNKCCVSLFSFPWVICILLLSSRRSSFYSAETPVNTCGVSLCNQQSHWYFLLFVCFWWWLYYFCFFFQHSWWCWEGGCIPGSLCNGRIQLSTCALSHIQFLWWRIVQSRVHIDS